MKKILLMFILILIAINSYSITITSPYLPWLQDRCAFYEVPIEIALAVAIVESNFYMVLSEPNWNESYDIGIFQINSKYVKYFEETFWYKDRIFSPHDPHDNIEMGILILRNLYIQTSDWDTAVRAYNTGLYAAKTDPDRSNAYLVKVINVKNTLKVGR